MSAPLYAERLGLPLLHAGKVRELYALRPGEILLVATDRISAFDFVLGSPIADKGEILTRLSQWWFDRLADLVPNHVLSADVPAAVAGRALVCERLEMVGVECVARGYLTGSGWAEYRRTQTVCGVALPAGLSDGDELPQPVFTPATKAAVGDHDENIDFTGVEARIGPERAARLRELTLALYARAREIAAERGLILADTKFEFGVRPDGEIVLADEALTPDSSRYWDAEDWRARTPGTAPEAFDKQYLRDWLLADSGWDRASGEPPPALPAGVVERTRERYAEAYRRLVGEPFQSVSAKLG